MTVQEWKPCVALKPFVERFAQRDARLGEAQSYHALPARSDCFLEFYFADRYRVVNAGTGAVHRAPRCVLVGPHSKRREDLILSGHLENFTIRFSAIGFRALFGIPARMLRDSAQSAELVLGRSVVELQEQLAGLCAVDRVALAEAFLVERLLCSGVAGDGGVAARLALAAKKSHGAVNVAALAAKYELSTRQVERMFQEHVGLAPKVFGRLARVGRAVKMGDTGEVGDWAEIALAAGYFDQSHMVREFHDLIGDTPVGFASLRKRASATVITKDEDVAFVLSGVELPLVV